MRLKLNLILSLVSLILLFISIGQIKPVIVEPSNLFGLASLLPITYWVGLALILLCSIFTYLNRKHTNDAFYIYLLVIIALFLFGISVFSQEYPRDVGAYFPSAEIKILTQYSHINIGQAIPSYSSWPSIHFITKYILEITRIDLLEWIRYFPLFWVGCFILLTYSIGKRLKVAPESQFLLTFMALASWWTSWSGFSPQAIAILLYLVCFMILIAPRNTVSESFLLILTFCALIITHSIAALAILLSLGILSIYRRQTQLIMLFLVFFSAWYMFVAVATLQQGIASWWSAPLRQIFQMMKQAGDVVGATTLQRMIFRYSQLAYVGIYGVIVIAALVLSKRNTNKLKDNRLVSTCTLWIGGILGLSIAVPSTTALITDMLSRLYLYGVIAAICILILAIQNRRLLVFLMVIVIAIHLPAHYGAEVASGQVLPTEFKGDEFFALKVRPIEPYFYNDGDVQKLIYFHNPELINIRYYSRQWDFAVPDMVDPSVLNKAKYIIFGKQGNDRMLWGYGHDPLKEWLTTEGASRFTPIYDNGDFQIYLNSMAK